MDAVIEALRPSAVRNWILAAAGAFIAALYVLWVVASPNSMLAQMFRGHGGHEEVAQQHLAPAAAAPSAQISLEQRADEPPALLFRELAPDRAKLVNDAMPLWSGPNPPAAAFKFSTVDPTEHAQAVQCMTEAVYYEAGFEPLPGAQAVAQVVINRLRHPRFPKTICGVVYQGYEKPTGCQFSFTCDGSRQKPADPKAWIRARAVAELALSGFVARQVGSATHYHADYVVPYWMPTMNKLTVLGRHIFYRWPGPDGQPALQYGGSEIAAMLLVPPGVMTPPKALPAPIVFTPPPRLTEVSIPMPVAAHLDTIGAQANHASGVVARGEEAPQAHETVELIKPELPVLAKLSIRPTVATPPPALMLSAPCAGPACGAWH